MKTGKKIVILLFIFIAAAVLYFIWPMRQREQKEADRTYSVMEKATLPVAYPTMLEQELEPLFGHREEKAASADRGSLIVLPSDRKLSVRFAFADGIRSLRYEIRNMDMDHLVERTELTGWTVENGELATVLPIQNLLEEGVEYRLGICAGLSDGTEVWYYARIIEANAEHLGEMLALARDFSDKTFHYSSAQELTMYMETSPEADNSSLGRVTLKNSFSQMTWGGLGVERTGDVYVGIRELTGELANIVLRYDVTGGGENSQDIYEVTESFTMKWSRQRVYMMDYERTMNQVFWGSGEQFSGKRILLGISDGEGLAAKKSRNGKFTAYTVNRDLWLYNLEKNTNTCVFSFGGAGTGDVREQNRSHDIQILELSDNGEMDFIVYGYMNRGSHEGRTGISYNYYDPETNTVEEDFFIPASESFEELKLDLDILAHRGENGTFFFYMGNAVYGIDLKSREYVIAASELDPESFFVSQDGSRMAWQEKGSTYGSELLYLMDLDTGEKRQIGEGKDQSCRVLGFVGNDCVYGVGASKDHVMSNGRIMGLYLQSLEIMDSNMENAMHYEKNGSYIRSVRVEDSRIHLTLVSNKNNGFFQAGTEDTLVCNTDTSAKEDLIGWYVTEERGRTYFVQLGKEVSSGRKIRVSSPKKLVLQEGNMIDLRAAENSSEGVFYAYGRGRLLGVFTEFKDAVSEAYDRMGFVMYGKHELIWARANKPSSNYIRDVSGALRYLERYRTEFTGKSARSGECLLLEASGCTLNQMLYFVGMDIPVLLYTGEGEYVVITGYDQSHVRLYDPASGQSETRSPENVQELFDAAGNDFICCIYR